MENDAKISYNSLADSIGVSRATIGREIKKLKDNGIILKKCKIIYIFTRRTQNERYKKNGNK
ncbi:hypothetical protein AGMMS50276_28380 [Synergistales bacterium]|nr:hypothetical protein AGMMS50276_28380 [Synergistales bacterium]